MSDKKIITVKTKESFKNAIHEEYDTIIIGGDHAQEIASLIRKNKTGDNISNLFFIISPFFGPAFFAGLAGKIFTRKMKKYEIVDMDDEFVTIKKKKK